MTRTLCALLSIAPPALAEGLPLWSVSRPVERCLVYAPDAIGSHLLRAYPTAEERLMKGATATFCLRSVMPTVTPVCFASIFTGAEPDVHGITTYAKPVLTCDTLFDALLRAGKRVAIIAVAGSSIAIIFGGRGLDYFIESYDPQVTDRALELIERGEHDFILVYHQEYDDALHRTTPESPQAIAAFGRHVESHRGLLEAVDEHWAGLRKAVYLAPDHGAHLDPATGKGTHGSDLPEDLYITHGLWLSGQ